MAPLEIIRLKKNSVLIIKVILHIYYSFKSFKYIVRERVLLSFNFFLNLHWNQACPIGILVVIMKVLITVIFLFSFLDKTDLSLPLSWSSIADEILPNVCESLHDYYFILIVYKLINQLKQQPRD